MFSTLVFPYPTFTLTKMCVLLNLWCTCMAHKATLVRNLQRTANKGKTWKVVEGREGERKAGESQLASFIIIINFVYHLNTVVGYATSPIIISVLIKIPLRPMPCTTTHH